MTVSTIGAALIGAVFGSVGAQVVSNWFQRRARRETVRRQAVDGYLLQLQDAVESVVARTMNITRHRGTAVMSSDYYRLSTLYALGCLLAQKRRLLLDGVYALLEDLNPGLGHDLQTKLEEVEKELGRDDAFQRYQRLALAEAVMERDGSKWSVGSYLDFSKRYDDQAAFLRQALRPAEVFVQRLPDSEWAILLDRLNAIGRLVAEHTHIAWRM